MNNQPPNQPWGQPGEQPPGQWGQTPGQPGGQQPGPWGQTPDQPTPQQWGQPGQQGQWGQQPQPDQWGGGHQPPGQWGTGSGDGGEPPKKKTGLIIAGIVAVLILIGGGIAAAVLLTGDDDDDKKADDDTSQTSEPTDDSSASETPSEDPSETPTESETPTDSETPAPPAGDGVAGLGYTYALPDGWMDVSDDPDASGTPSIDTVSAWGSQLNGSRANMIVETQPSGGATSPEDVKDSWIRTMTTAAGGATPEDAASITVDGQESVGVRFERDNGRGVDIVQVAHLLVNGDTTYAITLSYQPQDEADVTAAFEEIIDSWDFQ